MKKGSKLITGLFDCLAVISCFSLCACDNDQDKEDDNKRVQEQTNIFFKACKSFVRGLGAKAEEVREFVQGFFRGHPNAKNEEVQNALKKKFGNEQQGNDGVAGGTEKTEGAVVNLEEQDKKPLTNDVPEGKNAISAKCTDDSIAFFDTNGKLLTSVRTVPGGIYDLWTGGQLENVIVTKLEGSLTFYFNENGASVNNTESVMNVYDDGNFNQFLGTLEKFRSVFGIFSPKIVFNVDDKGIVNFGGNPINQSFAKTAVFWEAIRTHLGLFELSGGNVQNEQNGKFLIHCSEDGFVCIGHSKTELPWKDVVNKNVNEKEEVKGAYISLFDLKPKIALR